MTSYLVQLQIKAGKKELASVCVSVSHFTETVHYLAVTTVVLYAELFLCLYCSLPKNIETLLVGHLLLQLSVRMSWTDSSVIFSAGSNLDDDYSYLLLLRVCSEVRDRFLLLFL